MVPFSFCKGSLDTKVRDRKRKKKFRNISCCQHKIMYLSKCFENGLFTSGFWTTTKFRQSSREPWGGRLTSRFCKFNIAGLFVLRFWTTKICCQLSRIPWGQHACLCFGDGSCWEIIIIKQIQTTTSNML